MRKKEQQIQSLSLSTFVQQLLQPTILRWGKYADDPISHCVADGRLSVIQLLRRTVT